MTEERLYFSKDSGLSGIYNRGAKGQNLPGCLHSLWGGIEFWIWMTHPGFSGRMVPRIEKSYPPAYYSFPEMLPEEISFTLTLPDNSPVYYLVYGMTLLT